VKPHLFIGAAALAAAVLVSTAASAVTFGVSGGSNYALPSNYDPVPTSLPDIGVGTVVSRNATLSLDGPAKVTFSYIGTEASYRNTFQVGGTTYFDNKAASNPPFALNLGAGNVSLAFGTANPAGTFTNGGTSGYYGSVAFYQVSPTLVYALFNDVARVDKDYDDMVVRLEIAPVPRPAAAFLLMGALGSLGGLGAYGRRKAALAA
jgi:hypothetical protein